MPTPAQYGGQAYGGSTFGRSGRPENGISVPGFDAAYYWTVGGSSGAYGQAAYGGRGAVSYPSAGLLAAPDPDTGTVTVWLWWAYASTVGLTRVDEDGTRTPVRGTPVVMPGPAQSRRNSAYNPKARDGLTGYTAGSNTTISQLTGLTTPSDKVTTGVRATATAAGTATVNATLDLASPLPGGKGFWARTSALATDIAVSVLWYDRNGTSLGPQTYSVPAAARTQAVGAWSWCSLVMDTFPDGAVSGVLSHVATGLPAGGTFDITGRLFEDGALRGDYFDGDYPGAAWTGTPGLSFSDVSPIVYAVDAEAPLDRPVRYELTSGLAPGYVASSDPVVLSGDQLHVPYDALLTHPGLAKTVPVWVEFEPEITNDIEQGVFQVIGRRNKVVISAPQRSGDEGELTFVCDSLDERKVLLDMLDDGSPLLLRTRAGYGHPPTWWLAFGKVSLPPPESRSANSTHEVRRVVAAFTETDRPSAATRPLVA